jgi:hypothetical protein
MGRRPKGDYIFPAEENITFVFNMAPAGDAHAEDWQEA